MQVVSVGKIAPIAFLVLASVAACSGVPPTGDPLAGLSQNQALVIDPAIVTLAEVGEELPLQLSITGGADRVAHGVKWISSDPSIATVDPNGTVLSRSSGVTVITATYMGVAVEAMVYSAPKVGSIEMTGVPEIEVSDTITFTAQVLDQDGQEVVSGPPRRWSSAAPEVATVDEKTGFVTGVGPGETAISVKVGSASASLALTVTGEPTDPPPDDPPPTAPPSTDPPASGQLDRAFPGAEGYGAKATVACDRSDVQVLKVSTTNGSGAGSLSDALDRNDPERMTVVVFTTGGTIQMSDRIDKGCLYIAGQTAPGDGVQLYNPHGSALVLYRTAGVHDIAVRHLRFRSGRSEPGASDVVTVFGGRDIILDHISAQFGNDEILSITAPATANAVGIRRLTLQRSMIAIGMVPHTRGSLIIVPKNDPSKPLEDLSVHHNLWAHSGGRNPSYRGVVRAEHINNVAYNWKGNVGMADGGAEVDYVANYFKGGPWSDSGKIIGHDSTSALGQFYAVANVAAPFQESPTADQRNLFKYRGKWTPIPDEAFVSGRRAGPSIRVTEQDAHQAYESVLDDVGANGQVTCDGRWRKVVDALDGRILNDVRTGGGPGSDSQMDHPDDFGGIPSLARGQACRDTDNDGMPDAFEERYSLNPGDGGDASLDPDQDGWTNIEEFVNGTAPR